MRESEKQAAFESHVQGVLLDLSEKLGGTIAMNLLEKSGLTGNKVQRDLNLLADAVGEAARHLHDEAGLAAEMDAHFGLDQLSAPKQGKPRADGATVAALLWMNAAMLHQRVQAGGWLGRKGIDPLADIKSSPEPEESLRDSWNAITRQDFLPVIEPATLALRAARLGGAARRAAPRVCGISLPRQNRLLRPTPIWAPTMPVPCSTRSWATSRPTGRSSLARLRRTSPRGSRWRP